MQIAAQEFCDDSQNQNHNHHPRKSCAGINKIRTAAPEHTIQVYVILYKLLVPRRATRNNWGFRWKAAMWFRCCFSNRSKSAQPTHINIQANAHNKSPIKVRENSAMSQMIAVIGKFNSFWREGGFALPLNWNYSCLAYDGTKRTLPPPTNPKRWWWASVPRP